MLCVSLVLYIQAMHDLRCSRCWIGIVVVGIQICKFDYDFVVDFIDFSVAQMKMDTWITNS